jgi:hypothetical protein
MSSFIEGGASDLSAFASIPLSDAFRRLPTNTHTFIGLSMVFSIMMFPFEANPVRFIRELAGGQVGDQPQPVTNNAGTQRRLA